MLHEKVPHTIILLSHEIELPGELQRLSASLEVSMPGREEIEKIVDDTILDWRHRAAIKVDSEARAQLVSNLAGLTMRDIRRLVSAAVADDFHVSAEDLPRVMQAKYEILARDGALHYEFDTAKFSDVGGFENLKQWLGRRQKAFVHGSKDDAPRGMLLLGVQGCGKSLAAKAVAGTWGVSLLRMDFGAVYNKFYGETEKNLREALATAEALAPCVLWIDELEKGLAGQGDDDGVSRRVLGTLLTWMAESDPGVFIVATANDIQSLPPELVRKGRFDEIFFVDLPDAKNREEIFRIHCRRREIPDASLDLEKLAAASEGFSGAEIEQAIIAAGYTKSGGELETGDILEELRQTRPLSVVMAERIAALRGWASGRTVPA